MWIKTVPYDQAEGELKVAYDRQARALGEPTELTLSGSLNPPVVCIDGHGMLLYNGVSNDFADDPQFCRK